jgi:hypothetical protein
MLNRSLAIVALVLGFSLQAQARPLDAAALQAWLQKYGAAWETRDPAAAGALFTADATYHEMPFDAAKQGRAAIQDYWKTVTTDQREIEFESRVIAVNGSTGVAHWKATFKLASNGATIALDGVFVLEFDAAGQCKSLREWWHVKS